MGTKAEPARFDCYANAEDDEPLFVLLARDRCAPTVVRAWADAREVQLVTDGGRETTVDEVLNEQEQIAEARRLADEMEAWRTEHRP